MAKGLGKFLLTTSVLAGAAVGSYLYLKKEGIIDEDSAQNLREKVRSDAAEVIGKERTYVDICDVDKAGPLPEKTSEKPKEAKEAKAAAEAAGEAREKVSEVAGEVREKVSEAAEETSKKAKGVISKIKDAVKKTDEAEAPAENAGKDAAAKAEDAADKARDAVKDAGTAAQAQAEKFEPLTAPKINAADGRSTIGNIESENFFNDEQ